MVIDDRLLAESVILAQLELSTCLLVRDTDLPWVVLVPRVDNAESELFELTDSQRLQLDFEIVQVSKIFKQEFSVTKVNIGMIGNMVRQLHIHIIGRFEDDRRWPNTIWGFRHDVSIDSPVFQGRMNKLKGLIT